MPRKNKKDVLIRTATLDQLLVDISAKKTWKWVLMVYIYAAPWIALPGTIYLTSFAGKWRDKIKMKCESTCTVVPRYNTGPFNSQILAIR